MAITELDWLCSKSPEFLTPSLQEEVESTFQEVLSFDKLSPEEIKRRVGVPHIRVRETDRKEVLLGWDYFGRYYWGLSRLCEGVKKTNLRL